jgi:hypothetical protein
MLSSFGSRDAAAGACQDALREAVATGDEDRYQVEESGSTEIVEIGPSVGEVDSEAQYEAELDRLEACYTEVEGDTRYCVTVRPARSGEASGTYYRKASGDLQILGYSIEKPEDLRELQERAWALFCK